MARYDPKILEEELKLRVAEDWFSAYDTRRIIGKVDFCVAIPATELGLFEAENALWAEAKAGVRKDIHESFVQLILTIGRARTFDAERPPIFLGAFDAEKIAFLPFAAVQDVFAQNDFNWNVAPSNHESKEFAQLHALAEKTIAAKSLLFNFESDEQELRKFIRQNFKSGRKDVSRIQIDKNNFTHIYRKWREAVLPHIDAPWETLKKKYSLYDRDFYLAELNVDDNGTADISDDKVATDFYITFNANGKNKYRVERKNADELDIELKFGFKSEAGLAAYTAFWSRYKRPPRKDYWSYIVKRLDLLVPQDVRERKGAFFTPQKWVELSQEYLAKELGENWQDEYTIWDCCAGTGNMEAGLTNKYKVWASTLDQQDVDVMKERIGNGANLLESHVFQFDFLNDSFDKLPEGLRQIVNDPEQRKKLVIYINPPYAEGDNRIGRGRNISEENYVTQKYGEEIGYGKRELYVQFLARMYKELNGCIIGEFSKLKLLQAPKFDEMRKMFAAELTRMFVVPANTFDNVKGEFPIGFKVWRTERERGATVGGDLRAPRCVDGAPGGRVLPDWPDADVYERDGAFAGKKKILLYDGEKVINDWVLTFGNNDKQPKSHGTLLAIANDFQNQGTVRICEPNKPWNHQFQWQVMPSNVMQSSIYFAVRLCLEATWLNDRDQFLYPNDGWKSDGEFQGDCLVFALFHGQNRISCEHGVNHWIPFTEEEVEAKDCFASHFMSDFLKGKVDGGVIDTALPGFGDGRAVSMKPPRQDALAYYRSHELGKTWYDVTDPNDLLTLKPIVIDSVDPTANRRAVKEIFRKMPPVRNAADGRVVRFTVRAAKKLLFHKEINLFGLCASFDRLFAASRRAWSETAAEIPDHRRHPNIDAYHHYIAKANVGGELFYVRFTVREDIRSTDGNEFHGTMVTRVCVYKAEGAEQSLRAHTHGEGSAPLKATGTGRSLRSHIHGESPVPFVDNKIALFLSAVNGGAENDKNGFVISAEARAVLDAGRGLWRYYHAQPGANPNAAYYDIRKFFQGVKVDAKGKEKMNATSGDEGYNVRLAALKAAMKKLAAKIEPKVYEYGFLKK